MIKLWLGALAALMLGVWVFSGRETLSGPFLYDDRGTVKVNPVVSEADTTPWTDALTRDFWGQPMKDSDSHKSFRPVTTLTYRLNAVYYGMTDTTSFHVVNVLLHGITSAATVFASNALLHNPLGSTLVGLLFATHPIHTEAVSNITGRAEILCALFYLVGFLVYVHGAHHRMLIVRVIAFVLTLACTTLSMFSKEQGIMLPSSCVVWDLFQSGVTIQTLQKALKGHNRPHITQTIGRAVLGALGMLAIAYGRLLLNQSADDHTPGVENSQPSFIEEQNPAGFNKDRTTRMLSVPWVWCLYCWTLVYPKQLSCDWSGKSIRLVPSVADIRALAVFGLIFLLISMVSLLLLDEAKWPRFFRVARRAAACVMAFAVLPFFLSSNIVVTVGFMKAERVMYLPALGYCQALVVMLMGISSDTSVAFKPGVAWDRIYTAVNSGVRQVTVGVWSNWLAATVLLVMSAMYGQRTIERNLDWSSGIRLWESAYLVNPVTLHSRYNYGLELHWVGRHVEAVDILESVVVERPWDHSARFAYGVSAFNIRRCMEAREAVQEGLDDVNENTKWDELVPKKKKELTHVRANYIGALGLIATCDNNFEKAGKLLWEAIQIDPTNEFAISHAQQLMEVVQRMKAQQQIMQQ